MRRFGKKFDSWVIIIILVIIAAVSFFVSRDLLIKENSGVKWETEVGKSLLSLALTAIAGGIIKIIFDERTRRLTAYEKSKALKGDVLDGLRNIFDKVDSSRLLIEAHRSAKTYGEQMRNNIIPSITSLYDLKRSLVDSGRAMHLSEEEVMLLRVDLHYMIAYLKALSEEYKEKYPCISRVQYFQEAIKEKLKEKFQEEYSGQELAELNIPELPDTVWKSMSGLQYLQDFLSDSYTAKYAGCFIDHFESAKKILKEIYAGKEIEKKLSEEGIYVEILRAKVRKEDLVQRIMTDKLGFIPDNKKTRVMAEK